MWIPMICRNDTVTKLEYQVENLWSVSGKLYHMLP